MHLSIVFVIAVLALASQGHAQGTPYEQQQKRVAADPQYRALASAWAQCLRPQTTRLTLGGQHSDVGIVSRAKEACRAAEGALTDRLVAIDGEIGPKMAALQNTKFTVEAEMERLAAAVREAIQNARRAQVAWSDCLLKASARLVPAEASDAKVTDAAVVECRTDQNAYVSTLNAALILVGSSQAEASREVSLGVGQKRSWLHNRLSTLRANPQSPR